MKTVAIIFYYLFLCFVLYGAYHVIFVLNESKWWAVAALLLMTGVHISIKEE